MSAFTPEEKRKFRLKKYLKDKAFEFAILAVKNVIFTELVVWVCGGANYLMGLVLALGYSLGWMTFEVVSYKKEWLEVDIKDNEPPETER